MQSNRNGIVIGLLLILVGGYVLLNNFKLVPELGGRGWSLAFGAISVMFLTVYVSTGLRGWGWLFPAAGFGSVAVVSWLVDRGVQGEWLGSVVLWSIALPFWVAYVVERGRVWWPILPGGVLTIVGMMPILSSSVQGEFVGAAFLLGLGLTFALVYLASGREHWWPLIPAGVLFVIGTLTMLAGAVSEDVIGAVFMLALGAVFLGIFVLSRENWWALIPAGIMATIGVVATLEPQLEPAEAWQDRIGAGVFFGGLALTFLVVWLLRGRYDTHWAIYPTLGLALLALLGVAVGPRLNMLWPAALVVAGGWLIYRAFRPRYR